MRDIAPTDLWHPLTCTANTARDKTIRHNDQVNILARNARRAGAHAIPAPRVDTKSNKQPDLSIDLDDKQIMVDVVVTNPLAPSNLAVNSSAIRRAEQRKHARYDSIFRHQDGFLLSSFAIDAFGGHGPEARNIISLLGNYAPSHSLESLSASQLMTTLRRVCVASQTQRKNDSTLVVQ